MRAKTWGLGQKCGNNRHLETGNRQQSPEFLTENIIFANSKKINDTIQ